MSSPDLTEPIEVAAREFYIRDKVEAGSPYLEWEKVPSVFKRRLKQQILDIIAPAAQLIYDQGYRQACIDQQPDGVW